MPYIISPFLFRDILLLNLCGSIIEYIINKNKVWVVMKEKKKENKKKNKAIGGFIVMIIVICLLGGCAACMSGEKKTSSSSSSSSGVVDEKYLKFSDDYRAEYDMAARKIINHYVNCTLPDYLNESEWSYADFDDQDDGKVMVGTTAAVEGIADKQNVTLVLSYDGQNVKGYYLCVGSKLYIDDGSCSDTMAKLGLPTNTQ